MSPLGKDTEFAARMCSTQPSLGPGGGVKATVTLSLFFDKVSGPACFLSSILAAGNWAPRGALIHGEHVPGGLCSTCDVCAPVAEANRNRQSLFVIF